MCQLYYAPTAVILIINQTNVDTNDHDSTGTVFLRADNINL